MTIISESSNLTLKKQIKTEVKRKCSQPTYKHVPALNIVDEVVKALRHSKGKHLPSYDAETQAGNLYDERVVSCSYNTHTYDSLLVNTA